MTSPPLASTTQESAQFPDSWREQKKRTTRARIHREAVRLAVERGLASVTVEEIAAAAEVSPRTLFNYFDSKEDALVGQDPDLADRLAAHLASRPADEPIGIALYHAMHAHLAEIESDPDLLRMRNTLAACSPDLQARLSGGGHRFERALVDAAYARTGTDIATDITTGMAARVALAAARTAFDQHRAATQQGPLADRLDAAFATVGIGPA
ncbi:MAG: TetR/AcrR family transcriptional regulator [Nostocoides sp.]